jgi:hypothetical protein
MSRTDTAREIGGAESSTTSENDALLSTTSAHHAACDCSGGRTIQNRGQANCAQSRGESVRDASMYTTYSPRSSAEATNVRITVSLPLAPTTSVSRPRGNPPDASTRSSASIPVGSPSAGGGGAGSSARSDSNLREEAEAGGMTTAAADFTDGPWSRVQTTTRRNTENMRERDQTVNGYSRTVCPQLVHSYIRTRIPTARWTASAPGPLPRYRRARKRRRTGRTLS